MSTTTLDGSEPADTLDRLLDVPRVRRRPSGWHGGSGILWEHLGKPFIRAIDRLWWGSGQIRNSVHRRLFEHTPMLNASGESPRRYATHARCGARHTRSVCATCMARTNLMIDDDLLDRVMRRYGLRTKTEAVDLALRHLAGRPMTTEEALSMRGVRAVLEIPQDQGPA